jgi:hypothetical protein
MIDPAKGGVDRDNRVHLSKKLGTDS